MSRHLLTALRGFEGFEVAVGWDPNSGTYFAYVVDMAAGEGKDPWLVNVGGVPGELADPHEVVGAVRPYAVVPVGLVDELAAEARASPGPVRARLWTLAGGPADDADADGITGGSGLAG